MKAERSEAFLLDLIETLPHKPYCTDELGVTCIRSKNTAINKKYLQVNQPQMVKYLIFDIDRQGAVLAWYDNDLPSPYWTSKNQQNGHAHIAFRLKSPVCVSDMANLAPIRYLAAIQSAMIDRLEADRGYAGLLTKNPINPHWQNTVWTDHEYSLDELADFLDLKGHPLRGIEVSGLGRNCELFDTVRQWSYKAIRDYWLPEYKGKWDSAVYGRVEAINTHFKVPLPMSEVKAIAKSIANWTYREFTPVKFRQSQSNKGSKGGQISKGGGRPSKKHLLPKVLEMKEQSYTQIAIAKLLGVSTRTIRNWL